MENGRPVPPRSTQQPSRRSRFRRFLLRAAAILLPLVLLTFCIGPPSYYSAKYSSAGPAQPFLWANRAIPDRQTEPHTCGFHALSSVYRAYGLDPERLRLRFRIGVDKPVNNLLPDSLGTIHPDMLRVLRQDGFDTQIVRASDSDASVRLRNHLDDDQLAVALIRVKELHWVVLASRHDDEVVVCDSLHEHTYEEPLEPYLRERVYSLLLISPVAR